MSSVAHLPDKGNSRFSAVCQFDVPHTAAPDDILPSISLSVGEFDNHHEAMSAALAFMNDNPAVFCARAIRRAVAGGVQ